MAILAERKKNVCFRSCFGFSLLELVLSVAIFGVSLPILVSLSAESIYNHQSSVQHLQLLNARHALNNYIQQCAGSIQDTNDAICDCFYFYMDFDRKWHISTQRVSGVDVFFIKKSEVSASDKSYMIHTKCTIQRCDVNGDVCSSLPPLEIDAYQLT